jgi:hypothetical protein
MGKAACEHYGEFSEAIRLNNVAANAARKALEPATAETKQTPDRQVMTDCISCYQEAETALIASREEHARRCPDCLQGD